MILGRCRVTVQLCTNFSHEQDKYIYLYIFEARLVCFLLFFTGLGPVVWGLFLLRPNLKREEVSRPTKTKTGVEGGRGGWEEEEGW